MGASSLTADGFALSPHTPVGPGPEKDGVPMPTQIHLGTPLRGQQVSISQAYNQCQSFFRSS